MSVSLRLVADHRAARAWCDAHGTPFGIATLATRVNETLTRLGRADLVLSEYPDDPSAAHHGLIELGRIGEAERNHPHDPTFLFYTAMARGDAKAAFSMTSTRPAPSTSRPGASSAGATRRCRASGLV